MDNRDNVGRPYFADSMPLAELIEYAYSLNDRWVDQLAGVVESTRTLCLGDNECTVRDAVLAELVENNDLKEEVKTLTYELEDAEQENQEIAKKLRDANHKINAIKYDLDHNIQAQTIVVLKSQVVGEKELTSQLKLKIAQLHQEIDRLTKECDLHKSRLDTWTTIAT